VRPGDDKSQHELDIAKTESFFRDVNERIAESARKLGSDSAEFICECDDRECTERVEITLEEYEQVRADGTRFLLAEGHENTRVEHVVKRRRHHAIVEKFNRVVAAAVRRRDPRTETAEA
jgi:hypothetical protein